MRTTPTSKRKVDDSDDDDIPLSARKKVKKEKIKREIDSDEEDDFKPVSILIKIISYIYKRIHVG